MRGTLAINPDSFDDTELGGFVRDALEEGKVVVSTVPEGCERHPNPDWFCPACGVEPAETEVVEPLQGCHVSIHVSTGALGYDPDAVRAAISATQAISNALRG